jgi:hypothetical protein
MSSPYTLTVAPKLTGLVTKLDEWDRRVWTRDPDGPWRWRPGALVSAVVGVVTLAWASWLYWNGPRWQAWVGFATALALLLHAVLSLHRDLRLTRRQRRRAKQRAARKLASHRPLAR